MTNKSQNFSTSLQTQMDRWTTQTQTCHHCILYATLVSEMPLHCVFDCTFVSLCEPALLWCVCYLCEPVWVCTPVMLHLWACVLHVTFVSLCEPALLWRCQVCDPYVTTMDEGHEVWLVRTDLRIHSRSTTARVDNHWQYRFCALNRKDWAIYTLYFYNGKSLFTCTNETNVYILTLHFCYILYI